MKRILVCLVSFAPIASFASAPENMYRRPENSRPAIMANPRIVEIEVARPVIPVTTTTTTTTQVPEINETTETTATVEIDLDALANEARNNCMMAGNVWAAKSFAMPGGVQAGTVMTESPNPQDNTCFSSVSMKSGDIKDMGRFFPARYFENGQTVECGSWINTDDLDAAILDATKGKRIAGTIAASVGGLAIGATAADLIGQATGKQDDGSNTWTGQAGLQGKAYVQSRLNEKDSAERAAFLANVRVLQNLCVGQGSSSDADIRRACDAVKDVTIRENAVAN